METPTLETPRLLLRPITEADIEFIHRLFSRPETNKYSSYDDLQSLGEAKKMYESYLKPGFIDHFRVIVELKGSREPVGTLGLYNYSEKDRRAVLGYDMLREYWDRGVMTEAVTELVRYGFERLDLNRIEATVDPENIPSVRLLERVQFIAEGRLSDRCFYKGGFHDECVFGLLKSRWLFSRFKNEVKVAH
jgi:ribosomal-protein-alanine N-acetyltransferase